MPSDNRISAVLSEEDKAAILRKIAEIRALLAFRVNLTPTERQELPKLGDKTLAFDEKCRDYMASRPELVPGFVDMRELAKDRALRQPINEVLRELIHLCEEVDDTALALGVEIYMADLSFYQSVRQAAKRNVPGADTIYEDLRARFPGGRSAPKPAAG